MENDKELHNLISVRHLHLPLFNYLFVGEKALIEFLQEEIEQEKGSLAGHLPSQLENFQIKYDGADVELTKSIGSEKLVWKTIIFELNQI